MSTPGRPRIVRGRPDMEPRAEILEAAASLFGERGYGATSTRHIAEQAGMRQASLYYYFAGKDEILLTLLMASVLPTLERVPSLDLEHADPHSALRDLVLADVQTLLDDPHNIGGMYLAPEVRADVFAPFRQARAELANIYGRLAQRLNPQIDPGFAGACCLQLVETVITLRRDEQVPERVGEQIVRACLRVVSPG